jgi:hypothetical protein
MRNQINQQQYLQNLEEEIATIKSGELYTSAALELSLERNIKPENLKSALVLSTEASLNDNQDYLKDQMLAFKGDAEFESLAMPVVAGFGYSHFCAFFISARTDEEGKRSFKVSYINPMGAGHGVPSHISSAVAEVFGIDRRDIIQTQNRIQHSSVNYGDLSLQPTNNHCGAFVSDILSNLINGDVVVSKETKRLQQKEPTIFNKDNFANIKDYSQQDSQEHGQRIRARHANQLSAELPRSSDSRNAETTSQTTTKGDASLGSKVTSLLGAAMSTAAKAWIVNAAVRGGSGGQNSAKPAELSNALTTFNSGLLPTTQSAHYAELSNQVFDVQKQEHRRLQAVRRPTLEPTQRPTPLPTQKPTPLPTPKPTSPSSEPSAQPSNQPSTQPSLQPTNPTGQPSRKPSRQPSGQPSGQPSRKPSGQPSKKPSGKPSGQPSGKPSREPSGTPSGQPSITPSGAPSRKPSGKPSGKPSREPSGTPSAYPSAKPTNPTSGPTMQPSKQPSKQPSRQPSNRPTGQPTKRPSRYPSGQPSRKPSRQPSDQPTDQPSSQPTLRPSERPTTKPTQYPTSPTGEPSSSPTPERKPKQSTFEKNKGAIIGGAVAGVAAVAATADVLRRRRNARRVTDPAGYNRA